MRTLQVFDNEEFGKVRTIKIDGEPWFVGEDVAMALGYVNPNQAIIDHVDEEDRLNNESLSNLIQCGNWFVNVSGVYSLIYYNVLPGTKKFKNWIKEVIKSVRLKYYNTAESEVGQRDLPVEVNESPKNPVKIINIDGIDCYELNGVVYLRLEAVARGLGFTQEKNEREYVRWDRVKGYLEEFSFPTSGEDCVDVRSYIPENIFYRLAMKAKNEVAERF